MEGRFIILDHPADLGIEATGKTLREAFESAAKGLMSVIVDLVSVDARDSLPVELTARDIDQLLVRWLTEVLYVYDGQQFVPKEFDIHELSSQHLKATVRGEPISAEKHRMRLDVKAITYHQLEVKEDNDGALVRVFLDI